MLDVLHLLQQRNDGGMMRLVKFSLILVFGFFILGACDKGGEDGGEPDNITMTTQSLTLSEHNFTISAPDAAVPEVYMNVAWTIFAEDWFKVRVTPGDWRPISQFREQAEGMNYDTIEFIIDEEDTLLIHFASADYEEWELYHKVTIGETDVLCESVGPVGSTFTRAQMDRMVESCRSLAAAE